MTSTRAAPIPTRTFNSIQILRGIAASLVVAFHIIRAPELQALAAYSDFSVLTIGVDIFFVISGFVMLHSVMSRRPSARRFLVERFCRVVPIYWIALSLTLVIILASGKRAPEISHLAFSYLFIPYTDPISGEAAPFLNVGWTLNYEVFFYLIFAFTLSLTATKQIIAISAVFGVMVALRPFLGDSGAFGFRMTSPLLYEFIFGMLLRLLLSFFEGQKKYPIGILLLSAGISLALGLGYFSPGLPRFIGQGIPAALIVAGFVNREELFTSPKWWALLYLGTASYSIYLFHVPLLMLAEDSLLHLPSILTAALLLVISVGGSICVHALIETPLTRSLRAVFGQPRKKIGRTTTEQSF